MSVAARRSDDTPVATIRSIPPDAIAGLDDDPPAAGRRPRRRAGPGRVALRTVLFAVLALAGYYGFTLYQVWATGRSDQTRAVDAIVVMGAAQYDGRPSPQLAARLDHAAALYGSGVSPLVVVTGGQQPGDRYTEAEASARYLAGRGVPESSILLENDGHNTYDSLRGVAEILGARGLGIVLVVTDPYHSLRSRMIAEDVGLDAYVSPTPTSVVSGTAELRHNLEEAAGVSLGRLIGFRNL